MDNKASAAQNPNPPPAEKASAAWIPKIRVEPWLRARLDIMASGEDRTLSNYVRRVLEEHARTR